MGFNRKMTEGKQIPLVDINQRTSLSAEEVDVLLHNMELKNDLLQYKVEGWCVWPILRFEIGCLMEDIPLTKRGKIWLIQLLILAIYSLRSLTLLKPARMIIKTYTSGLVERKEIYYKDIWFDDLLLSVGDYVKIETINNRKFIRRRKTALTKSNLVTNLLDLVTALLARVGGPRYISEIAGKLYTGLNNELKLNGITLRWAERRLRNFYWCKKIYTYLLRRVRPAYLLTADPGEYALVAAAKEQGIKVIELQHGLINRHHYAYSWMADAVKNKRWMPIPDCLFLWGEYWKQELEMNGFWGNALYVVGSLRMEEYRHRKAAKKKEQVCTLLLTSQGIDVERIIAFVSDVLEASKGKHDIRLYIKLHPVYETSKTLYEGAFKDDPRVQVLLGNEDPSTFDLLTLVDFHLSISSTCHYDALGLGVPTIILPFATHESIVSLYEMGHAFLARTPTELLDILLRWKGREVPNEVGEFYFKKGALENMKREVIR
jgi:hypothetical protein